VERDRLGERGEFTLEVAALGPGHPVVLLLCACDDAAHVVQHALQLGFLAHHKAPIAGGTPTLLETDHTGVIASIAKAEEVVKTTLAHGGQKTHDGLVVTFAVVLLVCQRGQRVLHGKLLNFVKTLHHLLLLLLKLLLLQVSLMLLLLLLLNVRKRVHHIT